MAVYRSAKVDVTERAVDLFPSRPPEAPRQVAAGRVLGDRKGIPRFECYPVLNHAQTPDQAACGATSGGLVSSNIPQAYRVRVKSAGSARG
jgi:hypothetical protein